MEAKRSHSLSFGTHAQVAEDGFLSALKMLDMGKCPIFALCSPDELKLICQSCVFGSAGNEVLYSTENDEVFVLGQRHHSAFSHCEI
uniref:Uncharacterized protein n=1 Tax=Vombatus ursinus TaxID=29139 RepID=A0A4X2M674_VOMUR